MRIICRYAFLLLILALLCQGCEGTPQPGEPEKTVPAVTTEVAVVPTQVMDKRLNYPWPPSTTDSGNIVPEMNLTKKNYYVVFDCSGSMSEQKCAKGRTKIDVAKDALTRFAGLVPADANLGMLVFSKGKIGELVPLAGGSRKDFVSMVGRTTPSGDTPLLEAIRTGYRKLEDQGRRQLGYGEYFLVVVTDGEASTGQDPTEIVKWVLDNTPVQIHTIGFCIDTNHSLNIPGRTVYKAANNSDQLQQGLADVLVEAETFDVSDFSF